MSEPSSVGSLAGRSWSAVVEFLVVRGRKGDGILWH